MSYCRASNTGTDIAGTETTGTETTGSRRYEVTCDEAFNVVMNNIDSLTDEQLSNLAFQVWAATQERGIVLCEEPSYEQQRFVDGLYGGYSYGDFI